MAMDARKQRILEAIVALYAMDGEPVGSGLLANYFDMAVSSATLRNEMAALTRLGLLEQPHTSAGRVPSPKGYRYYLDHLLQGSGATALGDDWKKIEVVIPPGAVPAANLNRWWLGTEYAMIVVESIDSKKGVMFRNLILTELPVKK